MTFCNMDLRPGGSFRFHMRSQEGSEHRAQGVFREIAEPERLVLTRAWVDAEGKPGHKTLLTVTFADQDGKTKLLLHPIVFESVSARDLHHGGWSTALDCLGEYLASAE